MPGYCPIQLDDDGTNDIVPYQQVPIHIGRIITGLHALLRHKYSLPVSPTVLMTTRSLFTIQEAQHSTTQYVTRRLKSFLKG